MGGKIQPGDAEGAEADAEADAGTGPQAGADDIQDLAISLRGVARTMLRPLFSRARETFREDGLFIDPVAVQAMRRLALPEDAAPGPDHLYFALRAKAIDDAIRQFLKAHPDGLVLCLADGLETQFWRLGEPDVPWYSIDRAQVIALRKALLPDAPQLYPIAASVLDEGWWDDLPKDRPCFVSMAGLLPYLQPREVAWLLRKVQDSLMGGELFFDTLSLIANYRTARAGKRQAPGKRPPMPFSLSIWRTRRFLMKSAEMDVISAKSWADPSVIPPGRARRFFTQYAPPFAKAIDAIAAPGFIHARFGSFR